MRSIDFYVSEFLSINVTNVNGMSLFLPYLEICTCRDIDTRCCRFLAFLKWASSCENFSWDYGTLPRYSEHLRSIGNAERTIKDKLSNIRQFLFEDERNGLIPKCVYLTRGRKRSVNIGLVVASKQVVEECKVVTQTEITKGFKKAFLYDLFGLCQSKPFSPGVLKNSYRKLAAVWHPDHNGESERFLACKDAYDYLSDIVTRVSYDMYVSGTRVTGDVSAFVKSVYSRIGGYDALQCAMM